MKTGQLCPKYIIPSTILAMVPQSAIWYHLWRFFQSLADSFTTFMATPTSIMPVSLFFATWWDSFCRNTSGWQVELIVTVFVQLIGFWLPATVYQLVDVCWPDFSRLHKTPTGSPSAAHPNTNSSLYTLCILHDPRRYCYPDWLWVPNRFPPSICHFTHSAYVQEMLRHFVYGNMAREILAYYVHRILHHPRLYARYTSSTTALRRQLLSRVYIRLRLSTSLLTSYQSSFHSPSSPISTSQCISCHSISSLLVYFLWERQNTVGTTSPSLQSPNSMICTTRSLI